MLILASGSVFFLNMMYKNMLTNPDIFLYKMKFDGNMIANTYPPLYPSFLGSC